MSPPSSRLGVSMRWRDVSVLELKRRLLATDAEWAA